MVMYMHNVTMCTSVHVRAKIMTSVQICTDGARTCTALHGYFCWPSLKKSCWVPEKFGRHIHSHNGPDSVPFLAAALTSLRLCCILSLYSALRNWALKLPSGEFYFILGSYM